MKKTENLIEQIRKTNEIRAARFAREIDALKVSDEHWNTEVEKLKAKIPALVEAVKSLGCNIEELRFNKTGLDEKWEDNRLYINFTMVPFNKKIKFYKFRGYTSSGASKNGKLKDTQGEKLELSLKEKTGLSTSVNQMCLEVDANDRKRVLVQMWV